MIRFKISPKEIVTPRKEFKAFVMLAFVRKEISLTI